MKRSALYLTLMSIMLLTGCINKTVPQNTNEFEQVKEAAWAFVEEQGWQNTANEEWQHANVQKVTVNNSYTMLHNTYEGKEALVVTFKDKDNVVVSTPSIVVDPSTNTVIGYMLGE